ncbi:hypothetical protein [Spirochaeta isovalerica]|uniref:Putative membrane protein n=1 Tax=Spirochaeta isovalerica TaxID=150 RepID=A0A841R715_9SPIO|nr:hypothetical protein [Spirochaeta isovalerica]MBB6479635.1 putative membrane protein [Spirochaeta isovalerica]
MYRGLNGINSGLLSGTPAFGGYYLMIGLAVILTALIVYFLVRNRHSLRAVEKDTPMEVLQKRLINGEITVEQFVEMRQILRK